MYNIYMNTSFTIQPVELYTFLRAPTVVQHVFEGDLYLFEGGAFSWIQLPAVLHQAGQTLRAAARDGQPL